MSTRANIIIKESYSYNDEKGKEINVTNQLFFYRHSDGYPDGAMPTLNIFMEWLKSGKIRTDLQQASGWLILLGAMEYNTIPSFDLEPPFREGAKQYGNTETIKEPADWKVGSYEPTTEIHGDIEFLYVIELDKKTITCYDSWDEKTGKGKHKVELTTLTVNQ